MMLELLVGCEYTVGLLSVQILFGYPWGGVDGYSKNSRLLGWCFPKRCCCVGNAWKGWRGFFDCMLTGIISSVTVVETT